jgi:hypothetical protein
LKLERKLSYIILFVITPNIVRKLPAPFSHTAISDEIDISGISSKLEKNVDPEDVFLSACNFPNEPFATVHTLLALMSVI